MTPSCVHYSIKTRSRNADRREEAQPRALWSTGRSALAGGGAVGLSAADIPPERGKKGKKLVKEPANFEIWRGASRVKVTHKKENLPQKGGGVRKKVTLFSRQSRKRLLDLLSKIDRQEKPLFCTLTYPAEYSDSSREWKNDLEKFYKRMARKYPNSSFIWKLEPQKRGAPHFHLLVFGMTYYELLVFTSNAWYESVGSGDEKHLRAGTRVEKMKSWRGVRSYASKYLGKVIETLQKEEETKEEEPEEEKPLNYDVLTEKEMIMRESLAEYRRELEKLEWPEEEPEGWASPGRFWGVKGRKNLPEVVSEVLEITSEKKVFEIMRLMRRYSGIKARNYRSLSILCNSPEQWERVLKL